MDPLVSICMPHLDSQPFTKERIQSILDQSHANWELIIVDSASTDGSRELLERYAQVDHRIRLIQSPRDGIYPNINRGIQLCTGDYVYIATSDDTMAPDCLKEMLAVLEQHADCGICHCCLEIIDNEGRPASSEDPWENYSVQKYFGNWTQRRHIRRAPHDGLMHFGFFTVYTSLTQLLIRRQVFSTLGLFRTDSASYADFEWGMRVALNTNIAHVPLKLATWRRHGDQATHPLHLLKARARGQFHRLTQEAIKSLDARNPSLARQLRKSTLNHYYLVDEYKARIALRQSVAGQLCQGAIFAARHPLFILRWCFTKVVLQEKVTGDFGEALQRELIKLGLSESLIPLN